MEYQAVLDSISKLKKPYKYYLYLLWRGLITVICCVVFLGAVAALIYLGIEKGWFDSFIETPGAFIFIFFVPIVVVIGSVVSGIVAIWRWGVSDKLRDWACQNYNNGYLTGSKGYRLRIEELINKYYEEWEVLVKTEDYEFDWLQEWRKTTIELPYYRKYPTDKVETNKVEIPLFYNGNYYSKDDYKQIISELNVQEGEKLIYDIVEPTIIAPRYYSVFLSGRFPDCIISRSDTMRSIIVTKDGTHTIVFLAQYSSLNDIEDICTPDFLESLIPSKKLSIIAIRKEYTKEELALECEHRRDVVVFNGKYDELQHKLESWRQLLGYPYYYFYNYYPSDMANIGRENQEIRDMIYDFKSSSPSKRNMARSYRHKYPHGSSFLPIASQQKQYCRYQNAYDKVVNLVSKKISNTFGCDAALQISFVCIPADSEETTHNRLEEFCTTVCYRTGMDNAFQYVKGIADELPKHMGGKGLIDIVLDKTYFEGKQVVIFDDIVTHGTTMSKMINALNECGAKVLFIITLAKTCNYISQHPINSDKQ